MGLESGLLPSSLPSCASPAPRISLRAFQFSTSEKLPFRLQSSHASVLDTITAAHMACKILTLTARRAAILKFMQIRGLGAQGIV